MEAGPGDQKGREERENVGDKGAEAQEGGEEAQGAPRDEGRGGDRREDCLVVLRGVGSGGGVRDGRRLHVRISHQ